MKMTTIYLTPKQIKFFENRKELSRSGVIRQLLDKYISDNS